MSELTKTHVHALEALAASDQPSTRKQIGVAQRTLNFLVEAGLVAVFETRVQRPDEEGGGEDVFSTYSITEAGLQAIAPQAEAEEAAGPQPTQSKTLTRCLAVLSDGKWHSYTELNTSSQNVGRLAERGLAEIHVGDDKVKRLKITEHGLAELAYNQPLH